MLQSSACFSRKRWSTTTSKNRLTGEVEVDPVQVGRNPYQIVSMDLSYFWFQVVCTLYWQKKCQMYTSSIHLFALKREVYIYASHLVQTWRFFRVSIEVSLFAQGAVRPHRIVQAKILHPLGTSRSTPASGMWTILSFPMVGPTTGTKFLKRLERISLLKRPY